MQKDRKQRPRPGIVLELFQQHVDLALTKPLDASVSDVRSTGMLDLRERQLKVEAI